jgi:hypothetical protein
VKIALDAKGTMAYGMRVIRRLPRERKPIDGLKEESE